MKRLLILTLVLSLLAIPSAAFAGQLKVFDLSDGHLESSGSTNDVAELARVWVDENVKASGDCNKFDWTTDLKTRATVAQWIKWELEFTEWNWQIRKPGVFASDGNALKISSNDDVRVRFNDFTNLVSQSHPGAAPDIQVAYGWDEGVGAGVGVDTMPAGVPASGWKAAPFTNEGFDIDYSDLVAAGANKYPTRIWNKIEITDFTRACNYLGSGKIVISVTDPKCFIDGETGNFHATKSDPY